MDQQRLLISFPARLLKRAKEEISSPASGIDNLSHLVTEALTQYLDELEAARAATGSSQESPPSTPSQGWNVSSKSGSRTAELAEALAQWMDESDASQASNQAEQLAHVVAFLREHVESSQPVWPSQASTEWMDDFVTSQATAGPAQGVHSGTTTTTLKEIAPARVSAAQRQASTSERERDARHAEGAKDPENEADQGLIPLEELEPALRDVLERESASARDLADRLEPLVLADRGKISRGDLDEATRIRHEILEQTRIVAVQANEAAASGDVAEPDRSQPLFGLHNRDYPSIWALRLLAEASSEGPVLWSEFASGIELTAENLGDALRLLDQLRIPGSERRPGLRHSTAFPNRGKSRKSVGQWIPTNRKDRKVRLHPFVKNNVARIQGGGHNVGGPEARGPLARWGAVAFGRADRDYTLGVTSAGLELIEQLEGLSLELPHAAEHAKRFLQFLTQNSPGDATGFLRVMEAIGESTPDREDLIRANKHFFERFVEKPAPRDDLRYAGTMTQGYVARGREWGLISPDQRLAEDGKRRLYELTPLGRELLPLLLAEASRD